MNTDLKRTPLFDEYRKFSPKLVDFAGWQLPIQFERGIIKEHEAVRKRVGIFDVSHMGKLEIKGPSAFSFLQKLTVNDMAGIKISQAQYTSMCNEKGCPLDDMILYKFAEDFFTLIVNAGNTQKILEHMSRFQPDDVSLSDKSPDFALIAVQGPKSEALMEKAFHRSFEQINYYHFDEVDFRGTKITAARLGYTGEDGFEILCPAEKSGEVWSLLLDKEKNPEVEACGLGARDLLRIEACFNLYGSELDEEHNLYESSSGWIVKLNKGAFVGSESLRRQKESPLKVKLVAFETESGIPRKGYPVNDPLTGEEIGTVTSGTMSPVLNKGIGLGFLKTDFATLNTEILIQAGKRKIKARIIKPPFVKKQ